MTIRIRNLSFGYAGRKVLDGIDMDPPEGRFTVVLGKNGSGKSTLFKIIAGLLTPDHGMVELMGRPAHRFSIRERARIIGFLPQHHRPVFPFLTEDVVLTGRAGSVLFTPKYEDRVRASEAMDLLGIGYLRGRLFTELSGGEQQMVLIARVIAQNPPILLFDEPTSHLDFYFQAKIMGIIRRLVEMKFTVIAILHDPNLAFLYGDHFLFLKKGRIYQPPRSVSPWDPCVLEGIYGMKLSGIPFEGRNLIVPKMDLL